MKNQQFVSLQLALLKSFTFLLAFAYFSLPIYLLLSTANAQPSLPGEGCTFFWVHRAM
jgi:hypothetical protein